MSMENFFEWMSKPISSEEVLIWFNVHNMNYEKIELCGDIFKTFYEIIVDTYMGDDNGETKISLTQEDKESHLEWCWKKTISNFKNPFNINSINTPQVLTSLTNGTLNWFNTYDNIIFYYNFFHYILIA